MNIGIVGHAADKFTPRTEKLARAVIRELLSPPRSVLVSGGCHLGGVDIWAEEVARELGREVIIFKPRSRNWSTGYKPRNLLIARTSDIVHVIVVREYPVRYRGLRFSSCYHCHVTTHVKSGGCWTARRAKRAKWHEV